MAALPTSMRLGHEGDPLASVAEALRRDARKERFEAVAAAAPSAPSRGPSRSRAASSGASQSLEPVVGLSTALFRPFVRLRSAPDPHTVRPEAVLRASLDALLGRGPGRGQVPGAGGWEAVREQLWSIRQDLLVQHLHRGALAAEVSLEGARLAVAAGDVAELHRCLAALVARGACASRVRRQFPPEARDEVYALRLLYLTHGGLEGQPGRLEGELMEFFQEHPPKRSPRWASASRQGPALGLAYRLHAARASGNWLRHLRLAAPRPATASLSERTAAGLADILAAPVRRGALGVLARAFPQGLHAERAATLLGLDGGEVALRAWLADELRLGAAGTGALLAGGRLACSAVTARLEELARSAAAAARAGAGGPSVGGEAGHTLIPGAAPDAEDGAAPIWAEMRHGCTELKIAAFVEGHAAVLRKMLEGKLLKKSAKKQAMKASKKAKKLMKKERKKAKKAQKKERKAEKRKAKEAAKRARAGDVVEEVTSSPSPCRARPRPASSTNAGCQEESLSSSSESSDTSAPG